MFVFFGNKCHSFSELRMSLRHHAILKQYLRILRYAGVYSKWNVIQLLLVIQYRRQTFLPYSGCQQLFPLGRDTFRVTILVDGSVGKPQIHQSFDVALAGTGNDAAQLFFAF